MHEFSICEGIIENVLIELGRAGYENSRIVKTKIKVGDMHQIVPDTLSFAYETLTKDTALERSVLEIEMVPVTCTCGSCGRSGEIIPPLFRCSSCGSGDIAIVTGRELIIESMEVEIV
jgi:hydrogenase nickel incorporation protein HypA/HybF